MRELPTDLAHRLAAEYALGTLRGRARARFEAIARADADVDAIRRQWEAAFAPFAERVPAVEPPARVWKRIEERIGAGRPAASAAPGLGFWRSFGLLAGGVAGVLIAAFLYLQSAPRPAEPELLAVLTSPTNEARMVISFHAPDTVRVRNYRPWPSVEKEGKGLELWVLPGEGAPRSLGMIPNVTGEMTFKVRIDDVRLRGANALALSAEPKEGSPTKQPTGRVLCSGPVASGRKI